MTFTPEQLEALAIYRTHKKCDLGDGGKPCEYCVIAKSALKEYDSLPKNGKCQTL